MLDGETLTALKGSVRKWWMIETQGGENFGPQNCALCGMFFFFRTDCNGCPVKAESGYSECYGTPESDFSAHHLFTHNSCHRGDYKGVQCAECVRLARDERLFLESLLPPECQTPEQLAIIRRGY